MSKLASPVRRPQIRTLTYGHHHPDRINVICSADASGFSIYRGNTRLHAESTHAKAMDWALRAAWGVEVIGR